MSVDPDTIVFALITMPIFYLVHVRAMKIGIKSGIEHAVDSLIAKGYLKVKDENISNN